MRASAATTRGRGRGVSATEITIGLPYVINGTESGRAIGIRNVTSLDQRELWRILVDDLNARGGIAGRRVKPVYRAVDAMSTDTYDAQLQAVCSTFTEDHEVFAVLAFGNWSDDFRSCLRRHGTVSISDGFTETDVHTFQRFPHHVEVSTLNLTRQARALVEGLWAEGYYGPDAEIGLVTYDAPAFVRASDQALKPALAAHGLRLTDEVRVAYPRSFRERASDVAAAVSSAVLRFRARGIDRVHFMDGGDALDLHFMSTAESQGYRPRYGLTSQDGGQLLADNVPKAQLHRALALSWVPLIDLGAPDEPDWAVTPARRRCERLLRDNGQSFPDRGGQGGANLFCEMMWFLEAAVEAAGEDLSPGGFVAGVERLGTSLEPTVTFATSFGPGRHDGAAAVTTSAFVDDCGCFRYTGPPRPLS